MSSQKMEKTVKTYATKRNVLILLQYSRR